MCIPEIYRLNKKYDEFKIRSCIVERNIIFLEIHKWPKVLKLIVKIFHFNTS